MKLPSSIKSWTTYRQKKRTWPALPLLLLNPWGFASSSWKKNWQLRRYIPRWITLWRTNSTRRELNWKMPILQLISSRKKLQKFSNNWIKFWLKEKTSSVIIPACRLASFSWNRNCPHFITGFLAANWSTRATFASVVQFWRNRCTNWTFSTAPYTRRSVHSCTNMPCLNNKRWQ